MQFPLFIELRRSRRLDTLLIIFHWVAAFSVCFALWPRNGLLYRFACLAILCLVALSAWRSLHRHLPERLRLTADGSLFLYFPGSDGGMRRAQILPDGVASPYWVVLYVRLENEAREYHLTLLPDQMPAEQFRQLIVCLRWLIKTDPAPPLLKQ